MSTTRLSRSIPFWVLVGGSVVAVAGGTYLLVTKLSLMASSIADGTATGVEVYAGQIWAVFGAILVGVGAIGLALALAVGAAGSLVAAPAVAVVEPPVWEESVEIAEAPVPDPATEATPITEDAPAEGDEPPSRASLRSDAENPGA